MTVSMHACISGTQRADIVINCCLLTCSGIINSESEY